MNKPDQKTLNSPEALNRSYTAPEIEHQRKRTIAALELRAGENILDIGCGTGFLTYELALAVGKSGSVMGIDPDQSMVDHALARCSEQPWVTARTGETAAIPAEDKAFDVVTCTQVLLYVEDVEGALAEMHRVLRPGGRVGILETDWRGVVMNSNFPQRTRTILDAWDATVASPNLPSKLPSVLRSCGFHSVYSEAIPLLNASYSENTFSASTIEWLAKTAAKQGVITKQEGIEWIEDLDRLALEDAYFFCVNRFLFVARKTDL